MSQFRPYPYPYQNASYYNPSYSSMTGAGSGSFMGATRPRLASPLMAAPSMPLQLNTHQTAILNAITNADSRTFVVFFDPNCTYSVKALQFLRSNRQKYKGYDITKMPGGLSSLLQLLSATARDTGFDPRHRTKPIIFKSSRFIGGFDALAQRFRRDERALRSKNGWYRESVARLEGVRSSV